MNQEVDTLVLGLGNPILSDDGVGIRVAEAVRAALPAAAPVALDEVSVGGLTLMEHLVGYRRAIIIDAATTGGPPGQVRRMTLADLTAISPSQHFASPHDTSLFTALEMGRRMGLPLPEDLIIYAIEVENVTDFGETLTPAVAASVPNVKAAVLADLADLRPGLRQAEGPVDGPPAGAADGQVDGPPAGAADGQVDGPPRRRARRSGPLDHSRRRRHTTYERKKDMISAQLIRRYPFFADLEPKDVEIVARSGDEKKVQAGDAFFHEGDELDHFYLVVEGAVAIVMEITDRDQPQPKSGQLSGNLTTKDLTVSTVGTGEVFGWSGLLPPSNATSGAMALSPCKVVAFDCVQLREAFEQDCRFGYLMTQKAAQVIRRRLRDTRVESLVLYSQLHPEELAARGEAAMAGPAGDA